MILTTTHAGTPVSIMVEGRLYRVTPDPEGGLDETYVLRSADGDEGWMARMFSGRWIIGVGGILEEADTLNDLAARLWS